MSKNLLLFSLAVAVVAAYVVFRLVQRRQRCPLPPGPSGLPLIGNVLDLPPPGTLEWRHYLGLKERYGPISSLRVLGQVFVILHDRGAIQDILESRTLKTASRPSLTFAGELVGYKAIMGMMPYDKTFKLHRKLAATQLSPKSILRYESIQELEVLRFLRRLSAGATGDDLQKFLNQSAGSMMLRILYNYETAEDKNDPIVENANIVMEEFSKATKPGAWTVDLIPWLRYVPEWVPGAGFQKTAKLWRAHFHQSIEEPFKYARENMAKGNDDVSYVAGLIKDSKRKVDPEEESVISCTAATMLNAGTDTTGAVLFSFFLAMILFPNVQEKAQQEIDRVVGDSRLPSFADQDKLPYVRGIVQESHRWHTIAPMGFPHLTTEDDVYKGYFIPKDTLIFAAVGSLMHDPAVHHDPSEFKPERYTKPYNEPNPADIAFGFGRRACPGRYIAEQTLFLTIAQTLAVFKIHKAVDSTGKEIDVQYKQLPGLISRVSPFQYQLTARSDKCRTLVD